MPSAIAYNTDDRRECISPTQTLSEGSELLPSDWSLSVSKRAFDILVSLFVLVTFFIPMIFIGLCIRISTGGAALFFQKRIGVGGKEFTLFKFRTMDSGAVKQGPGLTSKGDARVTRIGRLLRKSKLDELPQLFNVLHGDMSLVGPRPKLRTYTESLNLPYRPGITGAATLEFRYEEELLQSFSDPVEMDAFYRKHIMPVKAQLDGHYMSSCTYGSDLQMLLNTVLRCGRRRQTTAADSPAEQFADLVGRTEEAMEEC